MSFPRSTDDNQPDLGRPEATRSQRCPTHFLILRQRVSAALLLLMLTSCVRADRSSEIDFLGSYFPAWMICILAGLFLTSLARLAFIRLKIDAYLRPAPLVYFCLIAVFTFVMWLRFFSR